jgi:hypothetical protein
MGLLRVAATTAVISGTASAVGGRVNRRQAAAAQQDAAQAQAAAAAAAPAPVAAAPAADDEMAQIQKLATMHSQGLLTDEEFAAAKAKALGI